MHAELERRKRVFPYGRIDDLVEDTGIAESNFLDYSGLATVDHYNHRQESHSSQSQNIAYDCDGIGTNNTKRRKIQVNNGVWHSFGYSLQNSKLGNRIGYSYHGDTLEYLSLIHI